MTNEEFQRWLARVEQLTAAQRERLQQVAQEQGDEAASRAAIELRVDGVALAGEPGVPLAGLVEANETCFRHSRKGPARRRGLSREQVPVRVATARGGGTAGAVLVTDGGTGYPGCARSLGVQHEAINRAAG